MYQPKNFEHLSGIEGFSGELLKNHFTLYQGYVNNFNKLDEILVGMEKEGKFSAPEYAELNRRLGWEFNGMRLHEYYFGNLAKEPREIDKNSDLFKAIIKEFGSYEVFEKDFKSLGAIRGIGWVVLYYDPAPKQLWYGTSKIADRLFNVWINEHDVGHLIGAAPILALDVFEHAYMLDYGLKRADYIETFFKKIDWEIAAKRFIQLI